MDSNNSENGNIQFHQSNKPQRLIGETMNALLIVFAIIVVISFGTEFLTGISSFAGKLVGEYFRWMSGINLNNKYGIQNLVKFATVTFIVVYFVKRFITRR